MVSLPQSELATINDLKFQGAFRLKNSNSGLFSVDYAVGTLAYNPTQHSLFIAGHAQQSSIAEYAIIDSGMQLLAAELPTTDFPLQESPNLLMEVDNCQGLYRITGMLVVERQKLVRR